jgi:hypothetical protein
LQISGAPGDRNPIMRLHRDALTATFPLHEQPATDRCF